MIITIIGGGSTFTPGIVKSILNQQENFPVTEIRMFDIDGERQAKVGVIIKYLVDTIASHVKLTITTDIACAYKDADFIFAQLRVGKYQMRELDEKIPLKYGVVGQETCGPGGLAYGLRTLFPLIEIIDYANKYAKKDHWILNYSNPAAIMAEACRRLRPDARIINICDMPVAIMEQMASILTCESSDLEVNYYGLNHFGWFTKVKANGEDVTDQLITYIKEHGLIPEMVLNYIKGDSEESHHMRHLMGSWMKTMKNAAYLTEICPGTIPNTYLQYYLMPKTVVEQSNKDYTRANEVMDGREKRLFEGVERYLTTGEFDEKTFHVGAHGKFIVDLACSLKYDLKRRFIVIVENKGAIKNLPDDAMVELPAYITSEGPEVIRIGEIPTYNKGLMEQQLTSEKLLVEGAITNSYEKVRQAFISNKTIPSAEVADVILKEMLEANKAYWPELK